jgi:hypothetical protein
MTAGDRDIHLLLSQRAGQLLEHGIQELLVDSRMTDDEEAIYLAISRDLTDQFQATKKKSKKKKSKRTKDTR